MTDEKANREALAFCEERLEQSPDDGIYWLLKGNSHYRLGQLEEAAEAYRKAAELGEVRSHAYYFYAACLLELGRFSEAIDPLERQIELTPNHGEALFLLGIVLRTIGQKKRGDSILRLAEEIDPELYGALFSKYAEELAEGSEDDMLGKGLMQAVRALKHEDL